MLPQLISSRGSDSSSVENTPPVELQHQQQHSISSSSSSHRPPSISTVGKKFSSSTNTLLPSPARAGKGNPNNAPPPPLTRRMSIGAGGGVGKGGWTARSGGSTTSRSQNNNNQLLSETPDTPNQEVPNLTSLKLTQPPRKPPQQPSTRGCFGWPCGSGYTCDWCAWKPKKDESNSVEQLQDQNFHLRRLMKELEAKLELTETKLNKLTMPSNGGEQEVALAILEKDKQISGLKDEIDNLHKAEKDQLESMDALRQTNFELTTKVNQSQRAIEELQAQVAALKQNLNTSQGESKVLKDEIAAKREELLSACTEKAKTKEELLQTQAKLTAVELELQVKQEQLGMVFQQLHPLIQSKNEAQIARAGAESSLMIAYALVDEAAKDVQVSMEIREEAKKIKKQATTENEIVKLQMRDLQTQLARKQARIGLLQQNNKNNANKR